MLYGRQFACDNETTRYGINCPDQPIGRDDVLQAAQMDGTLSIEGNMAILVAFGVASRVLGYFALKYLHTAHKTKHSPQKKGN